MQLTTFVFSDHCFGSDSTEQHEEHADQPDTLPHQVEEIQGCLEGRQGQLDCTVALLSYQLVLEVCPVHSIRNKIFLYGITAKNPGYLEKLLRHWTYCI